MDAENNFDSMLCQTMADLTEQFAHPLAIEAAVRHVTMAAVELMPAARGRHAGLHRAMRRPSARISLARVQGRRHGDGVSVQLYTHDKRRAALNVYGALSHIFGDDEETIGAMLATQAANAFIALDKELQFRSALASRDVIGQAKGMLMERFDIDAVQAFDLLRAISPSTNTSVAQLATAIPDRRAG